MLLTVSAADIAIGQASVYALLGYGVVFFGLILLMLVVVLLGKFFVATAGRKNVATPVSAPEEPVAPEVAPGTAGELKLHSVEPKTAAMLMAIVADKLGRPINELRFLSIREVSE
jgi:Na+-transporting methylmalonyl-CoA/oxaloacetate decarboxylase gamma subunit